MKNNNGLSLIFIIFLILFFAFVGTGAYFGYKFYLTGGFDKLNPFNQSIQETETLPEEEIIEPAPEESQEIIETEQQTFNSQEIVPKTPVTPIEIPAEEVKQTAPKVIPNPFKEYPYTPTKPSPTPTKPTPTTPTPSPTPNYSKTILNKKVYLVIFNPLVEGKTTVDYFKWNNPETLTQNVINFYKEVTGGRVSYSIQKRVVYDSFPIKSDGFKYDSVSYLKCMTSNNKSSDCHNPDIANYLDILKLTDACTLLNKGEIDELWMWGGPYFGFYESNVAGPKGFFVNSGPTTGSTCEKILPIMGFNYERGQNEAIHNFGHRAESVMKEVYGSWKPEKTHGWNSFSLLDKDVKGKAGCGNIHYTSNSTREYIYDNSSKVLSNCAEYKFFPIINGVYKEVSCSAWGCNELGYYRYWWTNFPQNEGKSIDPIINKEIQNNWLLYVFDFAWRN